MKTKNIFFCGLGLGIIITTFVIAFSRFPVLAGVTEVIVITIGAIIFSIAITPSIMTFSERLGQRRKIKNQTGYSGIKV